VKKFDVAVAGLGAMGSATCLALSDHGISVIGFETSAEDAVGSSKADKLTKSTMTRMPPPLLTRCVAFCFENRAVDATEGRKRGWGCGRKLGLPRR
jgi:flavin-dependent dehydrogenase